METMKLPRTKKKSDKMGIHRYYEHGESYRTMKGYMVSPRKAGVGYPWSSGRAGSRKEAGAGRKRTDP